MSEIAIIGASSPFLPASTKKPGSAPFGTTSHPSELLAQARANSRNAQWWREQLDALDDDLAKAEWALALWCVASEPIVTELLPTLESVLSQLPAARRSTVLQAAERIARYGWLSNRPVTAATDDPELAALNQLRTSASSTTVRDGVVPASRDGLDSAPSLLSVAREGKWLKVDAKAVYR